MTQSRTGTVRGKARAAVLLACAIAVCGLLGVLAQETAKGFRYVLEYYENGQPKTQIKAGSVTPGEASVKAEKVRGECYAEDGELDVVILADRCEYSKDKLLVTSDSNVTVEKDDITLSGTGFRWDGKEQVVEIKSKVRLTFLRKGSIKSTLRHSGKAGAATRKTKR